MLIPMKTLVLVMTFAAILLVVVLIQTPPQLPSNTISHNTQYYDPATEREVRALKKKAIETSNPGLVGFEESEGFAGHAVRVVTRGSDHYFAYLTLGSGVPIAQALCYRVDRAMRVYTIGEFPDPLDSVAGYNDVDPTTCRGTNPPGE